MTKTALYSQGSRFCNGFTGPNSFRGFRETGPRARIIAVISCDSSKLLSHSNSRYKPTRVRSSSATLIDNSFVNIPEQVLVSGNILSDISDHFSQFCILFSIVDQPKEKRKERDFSKFSSRSFIADLIQVDWDDIIARGTDDINKILSSFYNKLKVHLTPKFFFRLKKFSSSGE